MSDVLINIDKDYLSLSVGAMLIESQCLAEEEMAAERLDLSWGSEPLDAQAPIAIAIRSANGIIVVISSH